MLVVQKTVHSTQLAVKNCMVIPDILVKCPRNMLSVANKRESKTDTVLTLKKILFKWRAQRSAVVIKSANFLAVEYINLGYWVTRNYIA